MVLRSLLKSLLVVLHDAPLDELAKFLCRQPRLRLGSLFVDDIGHGPLHSLPRLGIILVHGGALSEELGGLHKGLQFRRQLFIVLLSSLCR